MRNRIYDADIGRFISEDPTGLAGGINLYAFGGNDPVTNRDPFGLCPDDAKPGSQECPLELDEVVGFAPTWPFDTPRGQCGGPADQLRSLRADVHERRLCVRVQRDRDLE